LTVGHDEDEKYGKRNPPFDETQPRLKNFFTEEVGDEGEEKERSKGCKNINDQTKEIIISYLTPFGITLPTHQQKQTKVNNI